MWKRWAFVLSWVMLGGTLGCDRGEPVLTRHPGYAAYAEFCNRCHGTHGDGGKAGRMAKRTIDLGSPAYADTADPGAVLRIVTEGKGRMKGYREKLTPQERDAVSQYVLELAAAIAESTRSGNSAKTP